MQGCKKGEKLNKNDEIIRVEESGENDLNEFSLEKSDIKSEKREDWC